MGHFNSFCASVELGGRPLHKFRGARSRRFEWQKGNKILQFPNAVVLNAVGGRNTQMSAKECKCTQKSTKECKCTQKSANARKRAQTRVRKSQRAENGGLDPSWLIFAFLGRPDFQSRGPKIHILKGFGAFGRKIGAPQKRENQPRRIQPPILGTLINSAKLGTKERKRALQCTNCRQPGLKQPGLGTAKRRNNPKTHVSVAQVLILQMLAVD